MSHTISLEQAFVQLSGLVRALRPGDEIVLTDDDKPIARIVSSTPCHERVPGAWKEVLTVIMNDDEHLEDFKEYMR